MRKSSQLEAECKIAKSVCYELMAALYKNVIPTQVRLTGIECRCGTRGQNCFILTEARNNTRNRWGGNLGTLDDE